MTKEDSNKFKELINDEAFLEGLSETKDVDAAQKYIQDAGVEISADEVKALAQILRGLAKGEIDAAELKKEIDICHKQEVGDELSEDELESVSGGLFSLIAICTTVAVTGYAMLGEAGLAIYDAVNGTNYAHEVPVKVITGVANGIGKIKEFEDWLFN